MLNCALVRVFRFKMLRSLPLLIVCILYLWTLQVIGFRRYDSISAYSACLDFGVPILFAVLSLISRGMGIRACRPKSNGPPRKQAKAIPSIRLCMLTILMLGISFKAAGQLRVLEIVMFLSS